jgi:TonB family protein
MKYLSLLICIITLFIMGCGHYLENNESYTPPSLKNNPRLLYPMVAYENAYSGTPKVILYINKAGKVERAQILESSGIEVLDSAAVEYSKNFIFNPATRNGEPVISRMAMDIKFELSNERWNSNSYVENVNDLYEQLAKAPSNKRSGIEKQILNMHNEFLDKMKDLNNYNNVIGMVIQPEIYNDWKKVWDSWPLSFLLYHDFIQRFPDFTNLDQVKMDLKNALKYNIQYIKNTSVHSKVTNIEKEILLSKIKKLVENKYPGMIKDIGLDAKNDSLSIF